MRRIAIVGSGGAGKTRLARALGGRLGIPVVHLDDLYWRGETGREHSEWSAMQEAIVARPEWIADGTYPRTVSIRLARADTVIFLDVPRLVCVARVLRRRLRERLRGGPAQRFTWSFVRYILRYPADVRPGLLESVAEHASGARVITLRSSRDVRRFLDAVGSSGGSSPPAARAPGTRS